MDYACFGLVWSSYCSFCVFFPLPLHLYHLYIPLHPQQRQQLVNIVVSPQKWRMMNHSNDLNMSASFTTSLIRPQSLITGSSSKFIKSSSAEKVSDTAQAPVSSRWNPTPEQVQILEEMFRRGTRSPTVEHIQQITTLLRRFGRVEGKNVFYWFQNHKARERQRRRREKLEITPGVRRACCEVEEWSTWRHLSISKSTSLPEEHVSVHRTQTNSGNGWTQIQYQEMSLPSSTAAPNAQDHGIGNQHRQYQMLELFPLGNGSNNVCEKQSQVSTTTMSTSLSQTQFVDFLPLSM